MSPKCGTVVYRAKVRAIGPAFDLREVYDADDDGIIFFREL